jgi:dihydrofolate reductase
MTTATCKITIHLVTSLDGFIAKKDNSVSWFETADQYEKGATVTDHDVAEFLKTIDCYVMGSRTYEHALELSKTYGWAYGDVPTIVLTHSDLPVNRPNIELYSGDLHKLINERLTPSYSHVWVAGGAALTRDLLLANLADELRIAVMPIILGDGTLLFDHIGHEQALHLKNVTAYKSGMVELVYEIKK